MLLNTPDGDGSVLKRLVLDIRPGEAPTGIVDPGVLTRLKDQYHNAENADAAAILEKFSLALHGIRMGGTWKHTNAGRLGETEGAILANLLHAHSDHDGHASELRWLDLGASDGTTTLEAVERFSKETGRPIAAVLADLNLWIDATRRWLGFEYRAADGEPILRTFGRRGLRLSRGRKGSNDQNLLTRLYFFLFNPGQEPATNADHRIWLINPRVQEDPRIEPVQMNALEEQPRFRDQFHAIRASNVLNVQYFDETQLMHAVSILHGYLKDKGLLVVSRNVGDYPKEVEKGTLWRKSNAGFERIVTFGGGSEIQDVVDRWKPTPKGANP
jgi:hypothetical protein